MKIVEDEKNSNLQELERFKEYKNELIDIVNEKETALVESNKIIVENEKQLKNFNFSIEKVR